VRRPFRFVSGFAIPAFAALVAAPAQARQVEVDVSTCRAVYDVFVTLHAGTDRARVKAALDSLLATRPYQVMFAHYNRSWRPHHLPPDVFERTILSLRWPDGLRRRHFDLPRGKLGR